MGQSNAVPVHESLMVYEVTRLYRTDEWWKAVVTYRFDGADTDETAVYLWHNDDEDDTWTRKNKYVIRTPEGWATDREIIDDYIRSDAPSSETSSFPVSDYYTVGAGETVFQSDGWWKAIVNVTEKGWWGTNEVRVYLWQEVDDEWRRRQKYAIKRVSDWEAEREIIDDRMLVEEGQRDPAGADLPDEEVSTDLETLGDELETHLSGEFI